MAGDPLWPYVVVSFDPQGTNGAALSQTDNKGNAFSAQAGSPAFSTTWAAVGGSSAWFNGSARAQCANNAGLNFGTGDFEVNLWLYQTARTSPWACVVGFGQDSPTAQGWRLLIGPTGQLSFNLHTGSFLSSVSTTLIPLNTATHVAVGRSNGVEFMYVNGAAVATTGTLGSISSFSGVLQLSGTIGANWLYTGFIDRLEILSGAVRHTADFTPETSAFVPYAAQVSGVVLDDTGAPCARTVRAYDRSTGALSASTTSNASTGVYSLNLPTANEVNLVFLDDSAGALYNDLIARVIPA